MVGDGGCAVWWRFVGGRGGNRSILASFAMKAFRQFLVKLRALVIAGLAHVANKVMAWWGELASNRILCKDIDAAFAILESSG